MRNSITESTKKKMDSWAREIQDKNEWTSAATQQEILDFLRQRENMCTPGFILRRQIQKKFTGLMGKIPGAKDCVDLTSSGNVAWDENFVAKLAGELESKKFDGYGDAKLGVKKEQWYKFLTDEAFCNRETAIKLIFALKMDNLTAAKFLLSNNHTLLNVRNPLDFICMFCSTCKYFYKVVPEILSEFENSLGDFRNKLPHEPTYSMTDSMRNEIDAIAENAELDTFDKKKSELIRYMKANVQEFTLRVPKKNQPKAENLPPETRYADGFSLQGIEKLKLFMKYLAVLYPVKTDKDGVPKVYSQLITKMLESQGINLVSFADLLDLSAKNAEKRAYDRMPFNSSVVLPLKNLSQTLRANTRAVKSPNNAQDISRNTIMLLAYFFITGYLFYDHTWENLDTQLKADIATANANNKKLISGLIDSTYILQEVANEENSLQSYIGVLNLILDSFDFSECYLPFTLDKFILICLVADPLSVPLVKRAANKTALQYLIKLIIDENYQQSENKGAKTND